MQNSIIIIDDEQDFLDSIRRSLFTAGLKNLYLESDASKAAQVFEQGEVFDLALIDVTMPEMDGVELLELIKEKSPGTECIMITAVNDAKTAVQCIKKGAYDYLLKPVSRDDLILSVTHALERKRLLDILDIKKDPDIFQFQSSEAFRDITTRSVNMLKIIKEAELHALSEVPILITGESGTGKEVMAKAIHKTSSRVKHPFIPVNMATFSPTLFDSEFFGHTRGAFTGASNDRKGYLEIANKGTLFLDEIGTLPLELQGKLLRVLEEGEYLSLIHI